MDRETWKEIESLFDQALALPLPEREQFLEQACGADRRLYAEVVSLLRSHENAGDHLEKVVREAGLAAIDTGPSNEQLDRSMTDQTIGAYRLCELIESGGMGSVYAAERADDVYRKRVAVKLIKGGVITGSALERFVRERQVLADLEHPNIARLIDGGTTSDGQPYLVMEHIEGQAIDRFCDTRRLSIRERLALFVEVCAAVHQVHRNLIVHRDIKPANLLVTEEGVPKLLDFGIAKILDPETDTTATQERLLTPESASPEQLTGGRITTSSDVYSLGVLLYQLIAGSKPFEGGTMPIHEVVRMICEDDPARPSAAVLSSPTSPHGPDADEIAARRRSSPAKLVRQLSGDLDNIVLMALRKDPKRRYQSAEQLSRDIERHLKGHAVLARKDTLSYRTAKFINRNRTGVTAAAAILLALVVGLVFAGYGLLEANQALAREKATLQREKKARTRADQEAERARIEAASHKRVADFLVEIFKSPDPIRARGEVVTAREILERGAELIGSSLKEDPLVRACMMESIGGAFQALGLLSEAGELYETTMALRLAHVNLQEDSIHARETIQTHLNLASIHGTEGRYDTALGLIEKAVDTSRMLVGESHPLYYRCLNHLGHVEYNLGHLENAQTYFECAYEGFKSTRGERDNETLGLLADLAQLLTEQARYSEAAPLLEEVLAIRRASLGSDHPDTLCAMIPLGLLYRMQGRISEAEPLLSESFESRLRILGEDHHLTLNGAGHLAALYLDKKRFREARELFELLGKHHGSDDEGYLNGMCAVYFRQAQHSDAEPFMRRLLAIRRSRLGDDHPSTLESIKNLATLLSEMGQYEESHQLFEEALEGIRRKLGPAHPRTLDTYRDFSNMCNLSGNYDEAVALREAELAVYENELTDQHHRRVECLRNLGMVRYNQKLFDKAEPLLQRALAEATERLGADHSATLACLDSIVVLLLTHRRWAEAAPFLEQAYAIAQQRLGDKHGETIAYLKNVAYAYFTLNQIEKVKPYFDRLYLVLAETPPDHPEASSRKSSAASLLESLARGFRIENREATKRFVAEHGDNHQPGQGRIFRDDDGTAEHSVDIDGTDDTLFKKIYIDVEPRDMDQFRLCIYGCSAGNVSGNLLAQPGYRVMVNNYKSQQLYFTASEVFGGAPPSFRWVSGNIPNEWLVRGENKFLIYLCPCEGSDNDGDLRIGIDRNEDNDHSSWFLDGDLYKDPFECDGELMIRLEAHGL